MRTVPKKIDPAVKERCVRQVLEHLPEYPSLTAREENRGPAEDLVIFLEPPDLGLELLDLSQLLGRGALALPAVDLGLDHPATHGLLPEPLAASDGLRGEHQSRPVESAPLFTACRALSTGMRGWGGVRA